MTQLPFSEACERNKVPILNVLKQILPPGGTVIEIGSGTGQHIVYFAPLFPGLQWQPSDRDENLQGLTARLELEGSPNILLPINLNVLEQWPDRVFNVAYSANTAHIMGWDAVCATIAGLGTHLATGGLYCLYGPFNQDGQFTSESNREFDAQLRSRDAQMGLRDLAALESLANRHHMALVKQIPMPANNQVLVFRKNQ
jgi:hypothetical protein